MNSSNLSTRPAAPQVQSHSVRDTPMAIEKQPLTKVSALAFSLALPAFGYVYLGPLVALLFSLGYVGGFVLWLLIPAGVPYRSIRAPYWATLLAFLFLHKVEENVTHFFDVLSSKVTGVPVPEVTYGLVFALLILPIGAWLAAPFLMKRGFAFGYFLAWTLFTSMGVTELAHFIFPLLTNEPYGYFPGMASVVVLAPLAWWGMVRLSRNQR